MSHTEPSTGASPGGHGGFTPPSPADLNAVLEGYEFLELLGRGGMGAVYKARQKSLDRLVAIKILPPNLTGDTEGEGFHFAERFQREARAMARLSHPHIIGVIDFGHTLDGQYYFVMEYIEGTDLHALIRGGELTTNHVLGWISQICDALQYAHSRGIVHRDIKPANIMISLEGQVKVADFGLAKLTGADEVDSKLTMTNMAMGTPDYVAPEALEMGVEVDHRADLYAVGVMLYEMLTGKVPRGAWKSASVQVAGLDPRFDALIERAMDADRDSRHQNASEISATLYEISTTPLPSTPRASRAPKLVVGKLPERTGDGPSSGGIPGQASATKRPIGPMVGMIAGLAVVGLLGFVWMFSKNGSAPQEAISLADTSLPAPVTTTPPARMEVTQTPVVEPIPNGTDPVPLKEAPVASVPGDAAPVPDAPNAVLPAASEVRVFEGHRYQFLPGVISWAEAKAQAESAGGHLATISRTEEDNWIRATFAETTLQHFQMFWVDGRLEESDPDWTFHDGSTERQFRWGGGRPYYRSAKRKDVYPGHLAMRNYKGDFAIEDCAADGENTAEDWRKRIVGYLVEWDDEGAAAPELTSSASVMSTSPSLASAVGAKTPEPSVAQDPVSTRLRELEQTFQDAYAKQVTPTYQAGVEKLNSSYLGRLEREIATASKAGQLDVALAFREEKTQVEARGTIDSVDAPETNSGLLPLRQTYRSAMADLLAKRDRLAEPLLTGYDRALGAYQDELTKAQNLDGAIRVKAVRDYAASRREPTDDIAEPGGTSQAMAGGSGPTSALVAPVAPPLAADQVLPPPVKATPEEVRELVEWCVGVRKGKVTIQDGNQTIIVESLEQIPKGKFTLVDFYIYELAMDEDGKARLETLGRVAELESVFFHKNPGTMPMEVFRGATNLKRLHLTPTAVDDAAFAHLSGLKKLEELNLVYMVKQFTGTGLGYINDGLLTLGIVSPTLSGEGLAYLPRFKKLQHLDLSNISLGGRGTSLKDADLAGLAALPDLITLDVQEQPLEGTFLEYLPKNSKLELLVLASMKNFRLEHLLQVGKLRHLKRLHLPPCELTPEILTVIAGLDELTELHFDLDTTFNGEALAGVTGFQSLEFVTFSRAPISDAGWAAIGKAMPGLGGIAINYEEASKATMTPEGFANALAGHKSLTSLQLNGEKFSDAWTPHIARLEHVNYLMLTYGRVTDEGVKPLMTLPLGYLRLDGTLVTDAVIPILKQCPTLHNVPVGGTKMSDAGKEELRQWLESH